VWWEGAACLPSRALAESANLAVIQLFESERPSDQRGEKKRRRRKGRAL
jgi:hypothetical protein